MLVSADDERVLKLKDYSKSSVPEIFIHAGQNSRDEDEDVMSFFSERRTRRHGGGA